MRNVLATSSGAAVWLWTVLLACCLESAWIAVYAEDLPAIAQSDTDSDNPQMGEMSKRDWNKDLKMWGKKRAWSNLHGGWGRKRSAPFYDDDMVYNAPPISEKRAWQKLQGGWGKRWAPDEEIAINQLASMLERDPQMEQPYTEFGPDPEDEMNEEKRNWKNFNGGWGKRANKWDKMHGLWGKREPAWQNLRGMWGRK